MLGIVNKCVLVLLFKSISHTIIILNSANKI